MTLGEGTHGIPVVGTPMVAATGVIVSALVFLPATSTWIGSLETVVHEGGHMVVAVLTGRKLEGFELNQTIGGGATTYSHRKWGPSRILIAFAGYVTPPIAGLAAASLVLAGKSWSLLWVAIVLLFAAWLKARNFFTGLVVLLAGAGIGWVAVRGPPTAQVTLAVSLVWLLLVGGVQALVRLGLGDKDSDPGKLAANTWVPRFVWVGIFWFVALVCLWLGARRLLGK